MNKLEKLNPDSSTWNDVRRWVQDATRFQHASLACQVMAGFALAELKKSHNVKPGQPKKELPHGAVILSWPEMCKSEAGISDDTARRWIDMANGIKARWKTLPVRDRLRALMELPPSQWGEADMKVIADATHKCTDGKGQMEFMLELGIAKGAKTGRNPGDDAGGNDTSSLDDENSASLNEINLIQSDLMLLADSKNMQIKDLPTANLFSLKNAAKVLCDRLDSEIKARKET